VSTAYLTVDAFAARLDADDMTVRRMIAAGLLEAINIARPGQKRARLRIPESELERIRQDLRVNGGRKRRTS
jgi:excisionase family DNA binding protein